MIRRIFAIVLALSLVLSAAAHAGLFDNKKVTDAMQGGKIKIGMSKDVLVSEIGYPPDSKPAQGSLFFRFAQSKVTAAGKEDSWTYQTGATAEGVKSITFKLVDDKVAEWNEWLDTKK